MEYQHMKRRRRKGPRRTVTIAVLVVIALALLAVAVWLALPLILDSLAPVPVAVQPQGTVKGLVLNTDAETMFADPEQRAAQMDTVISYAAQQGFNALFVQVAVEDTAAEKGYRIFYRDRAFETYSALTANDTLFHKEDALKLLCSRAAEQGMAVYALMPASAADHKEMAKSIDRLTGHYAVAGVYTVSERGEAAIGTLRALGAGSLPNLTYANSDVWDRSSALFLAMVETENAGVVLENYALATENAPVLSVLLSAMDDTIARPTWQTYTPQTKLQITYPEDGSKLTLSECFIMGTSNPLVPLTLNGEAVERTSKTGLFGTLVQLQEGENILSFVQDGEEVALTLHYKKPNGARGSVVPDDTKEVEPGDFVKTTGWINSVLYDPSDDGNISETVRGGTVARVVDCAETRRNGKKTWAYQLASGDYVLAYNTEYIGQAQASSYTGATAQQNESSETITFTGTGQPLIYTERVDNQLKLHLYDTEIAADFAVTGSNMVRGAAVAAQENYTELTLSFDAPLYGHDIAFSDNTLVLTLKRTPVRSTTPGKPLEGVSVLLDAGHGADDAGAMGTAGTEAPQEKDVNLAVTLAAKYRLEQMGARVETVRTDDSFLTLIERNQLISTVQPDFFIAVHHNSISLNTDANNVGGVEAYYFYPNGEALAQNLVQRIAARTGRTERGAKWGYYYVARNTMCPAVLLEVGFMVNPVEYEKVADAQTIWSTGDAIAMSVLDQTNLA